ncbi:histone deacetylase family protein [Scytonema sp. UIC 10036]|uniref:histone deacetylase family protein n=1 Tax=Scytonema sp. UIC 10036 TaxID=2304196 RepID=UPI0012DA33F6|nr:histone deacetylase family protein [Scytonema sp. UIC 10036]MUG93668.1 histone deacetylase family protein [Scytonema sp. UIC 10036]
MKIFINEIHRKHEINFELFNGQKLECPEVSERVEVILEDLGKIHKIEFSLITTVPEDLILEIHKQDYVQFLKNLEVCETPIIYPSVFKFSKWLKQEHSKPIILASKYCFDLFTPFTPNIWEVAKNSVSLAYSAAKHTIQTGEYSYSICRPPGHHATESMAGGYCYLANASIAAKYALNCGFFPAILDIDFHHGNGTQEIFYDSSDVLTISIHAHPNNKYPYFSGFEYEVGADRGVGFNRNFCLPSGSVEGVYLEVLEQALTEIRSKKIDILFVTVGFDTYKLDPIGGFLLDIESYSKIARKIRELNIRTVLIQEGGYNLQYLGKCVSSFLEPFLY